MKDQNPKCLNCRKKSATYGFFCSVSCQKEWEKKEVAELKDKEFKEFLKLVNELDSLLMIKEGCGTEFVMEGQDVQCGEDFEYKDQVKVILCPRCLTIAKKLEELKDKIKELSNGKCQRK